MSRIEDVQEVPGSASEAGRPQQAPDTKDPVAAKWQRARQPRCSWRGRLTRPLMHVMPMSDRWGRFLTGGGRGRFRLGRGRERQDGDMGLLDWDHNAYY